MGGGGVQPPKSTWNFNKGGPAPWALSPSTTPLTLIEIAVYATVRKVCQQFN
jgi:hypothetical protein